MSAADIERYTETAKWIVKVEIAGDLVFIGILLIIIFFLWLLGKKFDTKRFIDVALILIAATVGFNLFNTVPLAHDIIDKSYVVCENATIELYNSGGDAIPEKSGGMILRRSNGRGIEIYGWHHVDDIDRLKEYETRPGTVVYGEHSKYLIEIH